MKTSLIISEYNPFHNGHKYMIEQLRQNGTTHCIALMGGNFLQRGDTAICDKWARTEMALRSGIDLVAELPVPYATAGAQQFAYGGAATAHALGCVDSLAFGSECGNIHTLQGVSKAIHSPEFIQAVKMQNSNGKSYPAAMQTAADNMLPMQTAQLLTQPNNVLALEYLHALSQLNSSIAPFTIQRKGAHHDSNFAHENTAGASYIRRLIQSGNKGIDKYVPPATAQILQNAALHSALGSIAHGERAVLYKLRTMTANDFAQLPDVTEGLEKRIYHAVRQCTSLEELFNTVKTKRYTHARIRRIIICAFLGITKEMQQQEIQYVRVLGFNTKGAEILHKAKETAKVPVITKIASYLPQLNHKQKSALQFDIAAADCYGLFTQSITPCGTDYTHGIIRI